MTQETIDVLYTYKNAFTSDSAPLSSIKGHEFDITLKIDRTYAPSLKRPAYPASPSASEALEKHIQELIQLGVLRKIGHHEEVEGTTPVNIAWNNVNQGFLEGLELSIPTQNQIGTQFLESKEFWPKY
ncbi:hypothetical protein O181_055668 [Austropuccinia psidii MF-1]|uniref:Uncharacterized protein n=1 Tax=Austropuccinia psidii MF-1 TaxID=1389203 RepID=A0A9Q3EBN0_9BASI|nr:hypothetical protein [Austropuccinia psidii MF-1]